MDASGDYQIRLSQDLRIDAVLLDHNVLTSAVGLQVSMVVVSAKAFVSGDFSHARVNRRCESLTVSHVAGCHRNRRNQFAIGVSGQM
jgi:hypothetical protein